MQIDAEDLLKRFLSYVQLDTQSDMHSKTTPSTEKQWVLIRQLERELKELGLTDVRVTEFGFVLATVPGNSKKKSVPRVMFSGHVDTADAASGLAKPIVHRNYQGQPIVLPDDPAQKITLEDTPLLKEKFGETIITASGKTLLGADDKAGVAIVMAAVRHLMNHPEIVHGPVRVMFNPDEEIGRGTEKVTLDEIAADVAYTLDSEHLGEIDYETFSADQAIVKITGVAAHPGSAKNVMVNALRLAGAFIKSLPSKLSPECTDDRDGFVHPTEVRGTSEECTIWMILRDFEEKGLEEKRQIVSDAVQRLRLAEPRAKVDVEFKKQYRNMRYWLEKDMRPVEYAQEAIRRVGLKPFSEPVRGGTDGSRLTERGLPTPNLFTGFHYVHSQREWVSLEDMCKAAAVVVELARLWEEKA